MSKMYACELIFLNKISLKISEWIKDCMLDSRKGERELINQTNEAQPLDEWWFHFLLLQEVIWFDMNVGLGIEMKRERLMWEVRITQNKNQEENQGKYMHWNKAKINVW